MAESAWRTESTAACTVKQVENKGQAPISPVIPPNISRSSCVVPVPSPFLDTTREWVPVADFPSTLSGTRHVRL